MNSNQFRLHVIESAYRDAGRAGSMQPAMARFIRSLEDQPMATRINGENAQAQIMELQQQRRAECAKPKPTTGQKVKAFIHRLLGTKS